MTVLDVSNWDHSTFDPQCMLAEGVTGLIVGCQNPALARDMVSRAQTVGLPVRATYAFLYFGLDTAGQTQAAIDVAREHGIGWVALDVESTPEHEGPGQDPFTRAAQLRECVRMVEDAGLRVIIYTGGWYWPGAMGDTAEFSRYPLWHSAYLDYNASPYEVRSVGYGGWTNVAIHQWTSTLDVCGRKRDANHVWDPTLWGEEGDMPDPRVDELKDLISRSGIQTWVENQNEPIITTIGKLQQQLTDTQNTLNQILNMPPHGLAAACAQAYATNDMMLLWRETFHVGWMNQLNQALSLQFGIQLPPLP